MAEEVIGSGFSDSVKAQFLAREQLFSSRNRTDDQLLYMNSNGAWARLVSSVNTLTAEEVKQLQNFSKDPKDVKGSKNLAYNNVLLGGTRKQQNNVENIKLKGGINYSKGFTPININDDLTATEGQLRENLYNNYNSLGFRPTPGIESVSIESKNTYGTLREAKIKIVAWTLEDLEVIQALYLRPGYSMLLEWGHSMYIDNDGNLNKNGVGTLYNDFLNSPKTSRRIEEDLLKRREEHFSNYDAMYGIVKNFSWSFRQDGGYDCEVTLVSKGSILESMSTTFDTGNRVDTGGDESDQQEVSKTVNPFTTFFNDLNRDELYENDKYVFTRDTLNNIYTGKYNLLQEFYGITVTNFKSTDSDKVNDKCAYIPLRTLLDFYNNYVAPIDNTTEEKGKPTCITRFYTGEFDENVNVKDDYLIESKYITSDRHFSIDPGVCLLPKKPNGNYTITVPGEKIITRNWGTVWINSAIENFISNQRGQSDDVLNIYLAVPMLIEKLEEINSSDNTQQDMVTYMQKVLSEVNDALGGVNDLDLFLDEGRDTWFVVDRKRTPSKTLQDTHPILNLTGLKSTISDLQVSSKISNEIASQVSIAAQGTGNNYKENVSALLEWNSGLIDRTIVSKSISKKELKKLKREQDIKKGQKLYTWFKKVNDVFSEYNDDATNRVQGNQTFLFKLIEKLYQSKVDYDKSKFQALKQGHKEFCSEYVLNKYIQDNRGTVPGVIPVELSFKTVGIGGIKIGQAFKIAKGILPEKYRRNFGFIVTGLAHDITGNKWETSIKTLFYSLNQLETGGTGDDTEQQQDTSTENLTENTQENTSPDRDWWTLVAICYAENFAGNYQGYADVAQSIYNRKRAGYFGGSIVANILGKGQYEPVFNNKADWAKIQDIDTATTAVYNSLQKRGSRLSGQRVKNDLIKCAEVLQNNNYKQEAVRFVGTRTEFLASKPRSSKAVGIVERSPARLNNSFFWRYEGKAQLYEKNEVAIAYDFAPKTDTA